MKDVLLTFWQIIAICAGVMVIYMMSWNVSFFIGHLFAHIYYKKEKLGDSPILFFPFVLTGGKRLHVFYDLHQMVNYFYPSSFFLDTIREIDKKSLSMHCLKGQKINFMGQILIMDTLSERHIWRKDM